MKDVKAAVDVLKGEGLKVGRVEYCWGGTISNLAATRLPVDAAALYYGGQNIPHVDEKENCPLLMHFGKRDQGIPLDDVEQISKAHPEVSMHLYDADHRFHCDHRGSYDASSAEPARCRTLEHFTQPVG